MKYFDKHKTYAGGKDCFELLDWKPKGETLYSYLCGEDVITCTKQSCDLPDKLSAPIELKPSSTRKGFTVMAVGNIDRDNTADVWSMNDAKVLTNTVNDVGT